MNKKPWKLIETSDCVTTNTTAIFGVLDHFTESVTQKTDLIDQVGLTNTTLMGDVYLFRDLIRDALCQRYNNLTILAFLQICMALDYFLEVLDAINDHSPNGLFDDIKVIRQTRDKFKEEIDAYQKWRKTQATH